MAKFTPLSPFNESAQTSKSKEKAAFVPRSSTGITCKMVGSLGVNRKKHVCGNLENGHAEKWRYVNCPECLKLKKQHNLSRLLVREAIDSNDDFAFDSEEQDFLNQMNYRR